MKRFVSVFVSMILPLLLLADIPENYYNDINGLRNSELKSVLHSIICKAKVLPYGSGFGRTWSGFYVTDRYENDKVRDRYSYSDFHFSPTSSSQSAFAVNGMNIEHSFPKSWWGGIDNQAYKDLFNLNPCESGINSSKSNFVIGIVKKVKTTNGCTKVGSGLAGNKTVTLWEPADEWKGDFARIYFYMVTAYSNFTWTSEGLNILENNEWPTLQTWAYRLLLEWNRQDPVDDIEISRNDAIYGLQGNRNPFVDFPNLAEYIWGDSIEATFTLHDSFLDSDKGEADKKDSFMAFDANEIVSGSYFSRFDANWCKYSQEATYILDVYTKDDHGNRSSLSGFPVHTADCYFRVSEGVTPNSTYYYQVDAFVDSNHVARSNEIKVVMPGIPPAFVVIPSQLSFTACPGQYSNYSEITISLSAVKENIINAVVEGPFEIADKIGDDPWQKEITLYGENATLFVRLATIDAEGDYQGRLILTPLGLEQREIPLLGCVDRKKSFFEDFEIGTKAAYDKGNNEVECTTGLWKMPNALLGNVDSDTFNGTKSVRMKSGGYAEMLYDKANGCDSLWFYAGLYNKDAGMKLTVSYSLDGGVIWLPVATELSVDTWQRYGFAIIKEGNIRLRFEASGPAGKRLHVDDVQMSDCKADETSMELLQVPNENKDRYDLLGRRFSHQHGIYIVNGKKQVR